MIGVVESPGDLQRADSGRGHRHAARGRRRLGWEGGRGRGAHLGSGRRPPARPDHLQCIAVPAAGLQARESVGRLTWPRAGHQLAEVVDPEPGGSRGRRPRHPDLGGVEHRRLERRHLARRLRSGRFRRSRRRGHALLSAPRRRARRVDSLDLVAVVGSRGQSGDRDGRVVALRRHDVLGRPVDDLPDRERGDGRGVDPRPGEAGRRVPDRGGCEPGRREQLHAATRGRGVHLGPTQSEEQQQEPEEEQQDPDAD